MTPYEQGFQDTLVKLGAVKTAKTEGMTPEEARDIRKGIGGVGGWLGGTALGLGGGALLGSKIPKLGPMGSLVGGSAGSLLGAVGGLGLGSYLGGRGFDRMSPEEQQELIQEYQNQDMMTNDEWENQQ